MEFTSRGNRVNPAPQQTNHTPHQGQPPAPKGRRKHIDWAARTVRIETFIVLLGSALLLAAVALYAGMSGGLSGEFKRVDTAKYQAVFLNGGVTSGSVSYSTYFGKVSKINDKYIVIKDVYYLTDQQSQGSNQSSSPQLTKLGCQQLHSPVDEMVINRTHVAFWENIKDDGKVVTAIKQYKQQNPKGPDCSQQSNPSQQQSATPPASPTTPTPAPTPPSTTTNTNPNREKLYSYYPTQPLHPGVLFFTKYFFRNLSA